MEHLQFITIPNFLFYLANFVWILEFIFFRNRQRQGRYQEKTSFWFLTLATIFLIGFTILLSRENFGKFTASSFYPVSQAIGLVLYTIGLWLRYQGSRALGKLFTRHVSVSQEMMLVTDGPYKYLRHPLYLGLLMIIIAFPIYVGNWLALLLAGPLLLVAFLWRMTIEEKALLRLHPAYRDWRKSRYRLIPFIY